MGHPALEIDLHQLRMLAWLVSLAFAAPGLGQTFSVTVAGGDIPDCAVSLFTLSVPPEVANIRNVELDITGLSHEYPSDFEVILVPPAAMDALMIMDERGDGVPIGNVNLTFSNSATQALSPTEPIVSGTYLPQELAEGYGDGFAKYECLGGGEWVLIVIDNTCGDIGGIDSFTLRGTQDADCPTTGACCHRLTGTCNNGVSEVDCQVPNSVWTPGQTCGSVDCTAALGACCDQSPGAGGACSITTSEECSDTLRFWTIDVTCEAILCEEVTGACCDTLDGVCVDDVTMADCTEIDRTWTREATCSQVSCSPAYGACCDYDSGVCENAVSRSDCTGSALTWSRDLTCGDVPCTSPVQRVPAVSTWGVVVLTIAFAALGKVWFGRRAYRRSRSLG